MTAAPSTRLDSQAFGPGESFELEIEGGAGGVQQGAGEFLFHCHIVEHYVSGMWGFWRVFDTRQPGLAPLPDRAAPPTAVDSSELIGKTINGTTITAANLAAWLQAAAAAAGRAPGRPGRLGVGLEGRQPRPRRRRSTSASPRTSRAGRTTRRTATRSA